MTMTELRGRLGRSLEEMRNRSTLDVKNCMSEIRGALLDADFPKLIVNNIEGKVHETINTAAASEKGKLIYQTIFDELSRILDPRESAIIEDKRGHNVVMFVGLRGVGKTKTCARYARHHLKKGFKPALVCTDVLRTHAFDRLNKAARDEVPVYGGYTNFYTRDPAIIAIQGITKFMKEKRDLIVVDTCGRHREYSALLAEMSQLAQAVKPDLVIFVIDARIGRAAVCAQALAFKQRFAAGVIILTNINHNVKAIGALGAVAAVGCPMILAETGENGKQLEAFEAVPFVRRLLELDKSTLTLSSKERKLEIAKDANVHVKEVVGLMETYRTEVYFRRVFEDIGRAVRKK